MTFQGFVKPCWGENSHMIGSTRHNLGGEGAKSERALNYSRDEFCCGAVGPGPDAACVQVTDRCAVAAEPQLRGRQGATLVEASFFVGRMGVCMYCQCISLSKENCLPLRVYHIEAILLCG